MSEPATPPLIHARISAVMGDIEAVGKNSRNKEQGYAFRSIDDFYDAIQPALVKHRVFITPTILEHAREQRTTKSGSVLMTTLTKVRFRLWTEDGSFVESDAIGEGADTGDKSANKAAAGALKYLFMQVFAVRVNGERHDSEVDSPTYYAPQPPRPSAPSRAPEARGGIGFAKSSADTPEVPEAVLEPPAPAPEAPKLTPKQRADAFLDLLKRSKSRFLSQVKPILPAAERYFKALPMHALMPNEALADIPASDLFPNADVEKTPEANHAALRADFERHMAGIKAIMAADDQLPGAEMPPEAEEPYHEAPEPQARKPMPAGAESRRIRLKGTSAKPGTKKNGQPYTKYGVVDSEGNWLNHFSDSLNATCESLKGQDVVVWFKTSEYGADLIDIHALDEAL